MRKVLNITNGDCAVAIMNEARILGEMLPWRDVLHEGPVPAGVSFEVLCRVRAEFIISRGWGSAEDVLSNFSKLQQRINTLFSFDEVVLWFEHDLYDQLQILQILDWFSHNRIVDLQLSIICTHQYLGTLTPEKMAALPAKFKRPITDAQLSLASTAWDAFRSNTPHEWELLLKANTRALPFLEGAVLRMLEEYPDSKTGLSRTAIQALNIVNSGVLNPHKVFEEYRETEERRFLGDTVFWDIIDSLLTASPALLAVEGGEFDLPPTAEQRLHITTAGKETLEGRRNYLATNFGKRWIGGVQITPSDPWCWNAEKQAISRFSLSKEKRYEQRLD